MGVRIYQPFQDVIGQLKQEFPGVPVVPAPVRVNFAAQGGLAYVIRIGSGIPVAPLLSDGGDSFIKGAFEIQVTTVASGESLTVVNTMLQAHEDMVNALTDFTPPSAANMTVSSVAFTTEYDFGDQPAVAVSATFEVLTL